MLSALSACTTTSTSTTFDRMRAPAVAHAKALTGEDMALARETGLPLLELMAAYGGW